LSDVAQTAESWSTQQLTEFLALVSSFPDESSAVRGAVERAAEALDAEVAAIVDDGDLVASIGFPEGTAPVADLAAISTRDACEAELAGLGPCNAVAVDLEAADSGRLLVARLGGGGFSREETDLLRGMARVLSLTRRMLQRQALLEGLSAIQRLIVSRASRHEVLDAVVAGASRLVGDENAALRLVDPLDPQAMVVVASAGIEPKLLEEVRRGRVGEGAGGQAIAEDRLIVLEGYAYDRHALPEYAARGFQAAMAAPVREDGVVVGSLVVATQRAERTYTDLERAAILALAESASLALTDAKTVEDALHQAVHDALTGLPNRTLLVDRLDQGLKRAQRSRAPLAVLFLDLDRFKTVNDSLGHAAGDELLIAVAARLSDCIRPGDTAARFGGDEFAILLEDVGDAAAAERAAMRILYSLEAPFQVAGREVFVTASIGIAIGHSTIDDPIRNADLAMYRAKASGKGRYEVFEPGMHKAVMERLEMEADLQRAVERDELILDYQPIVDLETGEIRYVEALVRWRHPERGLVSPGEFIPLAEETQLMPQLGRWVLIAACAQGARWLADRPDDTGFGVCVNISGRQLQSPGLVEDVTAALERASLAPERLILEITETVLMHDIEATIAKLRQLKALGVSLAVDDFGTGYSSLQYLRRFPIDILKIDKAFVDDIEGADADSTLARAIIDLGESFQLRVVAEGIERHEQRRRLVELGCDLGQGFHFTRPLHAAAMTELLLEHAPFSGVVARAA
jgi:diguanylate cyclase (GGDEF)-like protein